MNKQIIAITAVLYFFMIGCKQDAEQSQNTTENPITTQENNNDNITEQPTKTEDKTNCFDKSKFTLPYKEPIDLETVKYSQLDCKISGVEDFLCGEEKLRYLALPENKKVKVILIPMDCGDFPDRFYLLTIVDQKIVSNLYVEGEWYEPEGDDYQELTTFNIDTKYNITVKTDRVEKGKTSHKETAVYTITDQGVLVKKE
ncbi:hypothetical protein [Flavobacterium sp. '19STA2R22 D10 B1']|uniref:hypothetical protein n=1 Tax=Flavobacterium aerium TaxID=3037261 RepID=UPI00278BE82E|nr:hypothetical protein [Flavobacterium sp. '19STA2R22 D10 B1']